MAEKSELNSVAQEPCAAKTVEGRKVADRPHNLTLFTSVAALVISIGGIGISWISYRTSSRTAAANLHLTEEVQTTSLQSELKLDSRLADFEQPSARRKPINVRFSWTLRNAGNTPATKVGSKWEANFYDRGSVRNFDTTRGLRFLLPKIDPHQEQDLPFVLTLTPEEFIRFRQGNASDAYLSIEGTVRYLDFLNREHLFRWVAVLTGDEALTVRQY